MCIPDNSVATVEIIQKGTDLSIQKIQTTAHTGSEAFRLTFRGYTTTKMLDKNSNAVDMEEALGELGAVIGTIKVSRRRQADITTWMVTFLENVGTLPLLTYEFPSIASNSDAMLLISNYVGDPGFAYTPSEELGGTFSLAFEDSRL